MSDKEEYFNGYELGKMLEYKKANGQLHDRNKIPSHLTSSARDGYIDAINGEIPRSRLKKYF